MCEYWRTGNSNFGSLTEYNLLEGGYSGYYTRETSSRTQQIKKLTFVRSIIVSKAVLYGVTEESWNPEIST